ncbi:MAG: hypothetical protein WCI03_06310 [bacterium]|jgi:hypothetical protein
MNTALPPPVKSAQPGKYFLSPMALSALVYPGAGQLMQRRWGAGIFFIMTSSAAVIWLVIEVFIVLKAYYGMAFAPMNAPAEAPALASLIVPFVIWLALYVAGIVDTAIATYRQQVKRGKA